MGRSLNKGSYLSILNDGNRLDMKPINDLLEGVSEHLILGPVPKEILQASKEQSKITEELTRLSIFVARGHKSWGGIVVGFPGSHKQITTEIVGTPYLRRILYPILDLHRRVNYHYRERLPALYLLGARFPDVFLRKFRLLASVTPHVVVITSDLLSKVRSLKAESIAVKLPGFPNRVNETWVQSWLCREMMQPKGLGIPVRDGIIQLGYLGREIPTGEGTTQPERLDILGVDMSNHSLVAFELKGPSCKRVELENLFLQGLEHRQWLELNKMAIKFVLEGPNGKLINTRKRVRLALGIFEDKVPAMYWRLRRQALRNDRYLDIDFVQLSHFGGLNGKLILSCIHE